MRLGKHVRGDGVKGEAAVSSSGGDNTGIGEGQGHPTSKSDGEPGRTKRRR